MEEVEVITLEENKHRFTVYDFKQLIAKYGSTSLIATAIDFCIFHCLVYYFNLSPMLSTAGGKIFGSTTSFFLHKNWVFKHTNYINHNTLIFKYISGILLGLFLNITGVGILNSLFHFEPWPSRIITATSVWGIGLYFNKRIVFKNRNN